MLAALTLLLTPLDLNALDPAVALIIDGLPVLASVEVVDPPDTWDGVTYFGTTPGPTGGSGRST